LAVSPAQGPLLPQDLANLPHGWIVARSPSRPFRSRSGRRAGPSSVAAPAGARSPGREGRRSPGTGRGVHDRRSARSRSAIRAFTMTDPGVHVGTIVAFTMERSRCSRWTETRTSSPPAPFSPRMPRGAAPPVYSGKREKRRSTSALMQAAIERARRGGLRRRRRWTCSGSEREARPGGGGE
jgi:hypothetical protein